MEQKAVTTDEEAKQFLQAWAKEEGRFADSHLAGAGFAHAWHAYEFKRKTTTWSALEALNHALEIAQS
jgi:hypothetical protein